jgi:hypothetical protein
VGVGVGVGMEMSCSSECKKEEKKMRFSPASVLSANILTTARSRRLGVVGLLSPVAVA